MIAKAIPMKTAEKSHFAKLVTYITDEQDTPFRLGTVNISNCYGDEVEDAVFEILNTQLKNQRALSDKTYHLIVSFRAGEAPSAETLKAIEQEICTGLGFKDHQRVRAVHCDTENLHIHIAINKVHPVKHTIHNSFQDYKTWQNCAPSSNNNTDWKLTTTAPNATILRAGHGIWKPMPESKA